MSKSKLQSDQATQLCTQCRAIFDRLEPEIQHENERFSVVERLNSLSETRTSARLGCKICNFLLSGDDGDDCSDSRFKLAARLRVDSFNFKTGCIRFVYSDDEREISPEEYRRIIVDLDVKYQAGNKDRTATPPCLTSCTDSDETFAQIEQWLRICNTQHRCLHWNIADDQTPTLPSRLLLIEASRGGSRVRLISTEGLPSETTYLTLSHRWGTNLPLRLTIESSLEFEKGLALVRMPPTFRDAVTVAIRLSVPYLWIDALCIRQDSLEDWSAQVKDMAAVYSDSYLNIAASDSVDSSGGLFRQRDVNDIQSFEMRSQEGRSYLCYKNTFFKDVGDDSLSHRAWVVQERFLSPRVLHFSKVQVHWECLSCMDSENLTAGLSFQTGMYADLKYLDFAFSNVKAQPNESYRQSILDLWDRLLGHYTAGGLTKPSDKAIAAHALALSICRHLGYNVESAYANGIWRDRFVDGILWFSQGSRRDKRTHHLANGSCSWSWLSMHGGIWSQYRKRYRHAAHDRVPCTTATKLIEVQADCTLLSPNAAAGGFAKIQGPLCKMILRETSSSEGTMSHSLQVGREVLNDQDVRLRMDHNDPDCEKGDTARQLHLLLCRSLSAPRASDRPPQRPDLPLYGAGNYECLLIEPVEAKSRYHRRVGYVEFKKPALIWTPETSQEIKAIDLSTCRLLDSRFQTDDVALNFYHAINSEYMYTITLV